MTTPSSHALRRVFRSDLGLFVAFGAVQLVIDATLMLFYAALGMPVSIASALSRGCAGATGYWLNGRFNFAKRATQINRSSFVRFWVVWGSITLAVSGGLSFLCATFGQSPTYLLFFKLVVEALAFVVSFTLSRYWIY